MGRRHGAVAGFDAIALRIIAKAVKGAAQQIAFYTASVAKMCAEMSAVRIHRARLPRLRAIDDDILAHERASEQTTGRKFLRETIGKPTIGERG